MKSEEIKKNIRKEIIKTFRIKKKNIDKLLTSENIESWDSLGHLLLIREIEKKFNISFSAKDIPKVLDEKKIYSKVKKEMSKKK